MTGSDCIDMIAPDTFDVPFLVGFGNTSSAPGIPFVPIHTIDDQALAIQQHLSIF